MKHLLALVLGVSMFVVVGCDEHNSTISSVSTEGIDLNKPAPVFEVIIEAGTIKLDKEVVSSSGEAYRVTGVVDFVRGKRSDEAKNYFATTADITVYNVDNGNETYTISESWRQLYDEISDPTVVSQTYKLSVNLHLTLVYSLAQGTQLVSLELGSPSPYTEVSVN